MSIFSENTEDLQTALDLARKYVVELRLKKQSTDVELQLFSRNGAGYGLVRDELFKPRLEYLRCKKESMPYDKEREHRHIDGQISEIKWWLSAQDDIECRDEKLAVELMSANTEVERLERKINKQR